MEPSKGILVRLFSEYREALNGFLVLHSFVECEGVEDGGHEEWSAIATGYIIGLLLVLILLPLIEAIEENN